jgi:hypothetical protein
MESIRRRRGNSDPARAGVELMQVQLLHEELGVEELFVPITRRVVCGGWRRETMLDAIARPRAVGNRTDLEAASGAKLPARSCKR